MVTGKHLSAAAAFWHASAGSDKPPIVRCLDYKDSSNSIMVGTLDACLWEISAAVPAQQQMLVAGHSSDVWGVALHPTNPYLAASVCDGNKLYVWDLKVRQLLRSASVGFVCRAVTFSAVAYGAPGGAASGYHIAVGGALGHIRVGTIWGTSAHAVHAIGLSQHDCTGFTYL